MGTSNHRSAEAAYKAPIKAALGIAMGQLELVVKDGVEAYADSLAGLGRDDLTTAILESIAATVRQAVRS